MNRSPAFYIWWKEVRAALPYFSASVACIWIPIQLDGLDWGLRVFLCSAAFVIGSTVVASTVFARDFSDRTVLWQFVLPVARSKVMSRKLSLVLASQLILLTSYLLTAAPHSLDSDSLRFATVVSVVVVCSSCFWATQLRNPLYSALITGAAPLLLFALVASFLEVVLPKLTGGWIFYGLEQEIVIGMIVWASLVAGVLGSRNWLNLQLIDAQPSVSRLEDVLIGKLSRDSTFVRRSAFATLVRKELFLIRFVCWTTITFVATAAFISVAHGIVFASNESAREFIRLLAVVILSLYITATPLLVGALAFTEERQLGNDSWNLTLACSSGLQFSLKLTASLIVNVLIGVAVPLLVARVYASLQMTEVTGWVFAPGGVMAIASISLLLFSTAAWSSAVSDTSLKSILVAGIVIFLSFVVFQVLEIGFVSRFLISGQMPGFRFALFGLLASVAALGFCWKNYDKPRMNPKPWFLQTVLALLIAVVTWLLTVVFMVTVERMIHAY